MKVFFKKLFHFLSLHQHYEEKNSFSNEETLSNQLLLQEARDNILKIQQITEDILSQNKDIAHKAPDLFYAICDLRYDHEELICTMRDSRDVNARRFARLIQSNILENVTIFDCGEIENLVLISNVMIVNKRAFLQYAQDLQEISWRIIFFGVKF